MSYNTGRVGGVDLCLNGWFIWRCHDFVVVEKKEAFNHLKYVLMFKEPHHVNLNDCCVCYTEEHNKLGPVYRTWHININLIFNQPESAN